MPTAEIEASPRLTGSSGSQQPLTRRHEDKNHSQHHRASSPGAGHLPLCRVPTSLGLLTHLPAPSLHIHTETDGRAGHIETRASFVLPTQPPQNKAPCLSCHAELPASSQAAGICCLPTAGAHTHTPRETNSDATKLFCKNPNCAPLVPPPERRRAGYNQESLQLRVTSDSLCYLPCPATVPAGRLTAAWPRLEQRALPARAHPRTGDTVGLPRGSNTQKYLLCPLLKARAQSSEEYSLCTAACSESPRLC